ncbi:hypothetical protein PMAYCL1PPCAC_22303, partial [Pristionchus mayeri]
TDVSEMQFVSLQANLIAIQQTYQEVLINNTWTALISSEFHANCLDEKCIDRAMQLRLAGINSIRPQVACYTYPLNKLISQICMGDFCYYESGGARGGCFTVDDSLAERKMKVGFYEYFVLFGYICDKNYCNANENSVKSNTEMKSEVSLCE